MNSTEQMIKEIEQLKAANAALMLMNQPKPKGLSLKVSTKGGVSLYGVGRWPVTLYKTQWEQVISKADEIKVFINANASQLSTKE